MYNIILTIRLLVWLKEEFTSRDVISTFNHASKRVRQDNIAYFFIKFYPL
jgi:hypothetical protein